MAGGPRRRDGMAAGRPGPALGVLDGPLFALHLPAHHWPGLGGSAVPGSGQGHPLGCCGLPD